MKRIYVIGAFVIMCCWGMKSGYSFTFGSKTPEQQKAEAQKKAAVTAQNAEKQKAADKIKAERLKLEKQTQDFVDDLKLLMNYQLITTNIVTGDAAYWFQESVKSFKEGVTEMRYPISSMKRSPFQKAFDGATLSRGITQELAKLRARYGIDSNWSVNNQKLMPLAFKSKDPAALTILKNLQYDFAKLWAMIGAYHNQVGVFINTCDQNIRDLNNASKTIGT